MQKLQRDLLAQICGSWLLKRRQVPLESGGQLEIKTMILFATSYSLYKMLHSGYDVSSVKSSIHLDAAREFAMFGELQRVSGGESAIF